jgi:hypothetical protein
MPIIVYVSLNVKYNQYKQYTSKIHATSPQILKRHLLDYYPLKMKEMVLGLGI